MRLMLLDFTWYGGSISAWLELLCIDKLCVASFKYIVNNVFNHRPHAFLGSS